MRHVRMLGLCLLAAFALSAMAASSAMAVKNPDHSLTIFKNCPVNGFGVGTLGLRPDALCTFGDTEPQEGGQFTVGPITVPLTKQIILQYGIAFGIAQEEKEREEQGIFEQELIYVPPQNGVEAITPTPEPVPGTPIANITTAEQEELKWPEGLKASYAAAQKKGQVNKVFETIEQAGFIFTSVQQILTGEHPGVIAPVKIKGENAWLSKLGDVCYIGSEQEPIVQHLTSGKSTSPLTGVTIEGTRGEIEVIRKGNEIIEGHSNLVDNTYPVPGAVCTGPYSAAISATLNKVFGLPAVAGASITELKGYLYLTTKEFGEKGGA